MDKLLFLKQFLALTLEERYLINYDTMKGEQDYVQKVYYWYFSNAVNRC